MRLKWSTSIATTASGRCSRTARATSASKRSASPRRLSTPVRGSIRDSAVSRATSRSLRAASVRTTAAMTAAEITTSHQRSIVPSDMVSSAAPWASAITSTVNAVLRVS